MTASKEKTSKEDEFLHEAIKKSQNKDEDEIIGLKKERAAILTTREDNYTRETEVTKNSLEEISETIKDQAKPNTSSNSVIFSQAQNRDPAILLVREKLLASIREKVKRID